MIILLVKFAITASRKQTLRVRLGLLGLVLIALQAILVAGILRCRLQCAVVCGIKSLHIIAERMLSARVLGGLDDTCGLRHAARGISTFTKKM